ncbi:uncharacterized protein LOC118416546 [Branchiostoma floridae]|uniref:Uncharacterized protein LOC118416546 n=1 Tax=Branchiostoma floridae TaxID=7739 RepID=A0A9J7MSH4_BRAFL|nr:uncharacterized protein LOC118416546 [Branchiostoma floridae]
MPGEKQQHVLEMHLLENERRVAWKSDRLEQSRLLPRLQNIDKRLLDINNKENSRKRVQQTTPLQGGYTRTALPKKSNEKEENAAISKMSSTWTGDIQYPDVFQDSHGVTQKQGGIKLDPDTKPFKSRATSLPEHPFIQRTLYHIPVRSKGSSRLEPKDKDVSPHIKLPSKTKKNRDHKRSSKSTDEESSKGPVKPRLVRRPRMDAKVLASLLNVDESSVEKQDQVFQTARLKADAALRVLADDTQENAGENEQKNKKTSAKIQRRASVASMHMSSDLLKVGFPALKAVKQTWPNTKQLPASSSSFSRVRRSSLPSLSTTNHGKFLAPGSTATRRASIGSTNFRTSSLDKLENVIEENEENLHNSERDDTISNLIQSVLPLSRRKKQLYGQQ